MRRESVMDVGGEAVGGDSFRWSDSTRYYRSQYVSRRLGFDVIECNSRYMVVFVLRSVTHLSCALESCNCAKYSVQ